MPPAFAGVFRPTFTEQRSLASPLLRLLVAAAEESGGAGDIRIEHGDTPFPRPALLCFGSGHLPGLLGVLGDQRGKKYVAAHAHGAAVLDHDILLGAVKFSRYSTGFDHH